MSDGGRRTSQPRRRGFAPPLPFRPVGSSVSCGVLSEQGDARPRGEGRSFSLGLLTQTLVPSRNTLTDTPRNSVLSAMGISQPVKSDS